jgi:hypothetical protein
MKEILNCPFKFDNNSKIVLEIEEDINDFYKKLIKKMQILEKLRLGKIMDSWFGKVKT